MKFLSFLLLSLCIWAQPAYATVTIFSAASTKPALDALAPEFAKQGLDVRMVYAASSTLARQIEHGAPADIYISANLNWMDYLTQQGVIEKGTQQIIANNALVVVANQPLAAPRMVFGPGYPIHSVLRGQRLAIANPTHVPAGMYAKQALQNYNMWDNVKNNLALSGSVTGALLLVERGEVPLAIVYASDVKRLPGLYVFGHFDSSSHDPIRYPAALIKNRSTPEVRKVYSILTHDLGRAAFLGAGFEGTP